MTGLIGGETNAAWGNHHDVCSNCLLVADSSKIEQEVTILREVIEMDFLKIALLVVEGACLLSLILQELNKRKGKTTKRKEERSHEFENGNRF